MNARNHKFSMSTIKRLEHANILNGLQRNFHDITCLCLKFIMGAGGTLRVDL
jgi:hypothetical protein